MNTYKKGNPPIELNCLNLYAFTYDNNGVKDRNVLRVWLDENGKPVIAQHSAGKFSHSKEIDPSTITMSDDLTEVYYNH